MNFLDLASLVITYFVGFASGYLFFCNKVGR